MLNKKLSGLFLRKDTRKEQTRPQHFDQNYFLCRLIGNGVNTELIRVQAQLKEGGGPLDELRCKWFIKNSHDFREIQDVGSSYYQPCLDDVGSIICVQIEPFIEGKLYNGITIMKESEPIRLDPELQKKLEVFLAEGLLKLDGHIEAVFSQNEKYAGVELPLEVKIELTASEILLLNEGKLLERVAISPEFPNIEFIRKSFNSMLFNFNAKESMKVSFHNNAKRDLFALVVRTCAAQADAVNPEQVLRGEEGEGEELMGEERGMEERDNQSREQKQTMEGLNETGQQQTGVVSQDVKGTEVSEVELPKEVPSPTKVSGRTEEKQSSTLLVLKLDEQSRQLKTIKRRYEQLEINYKLQKNTKLTYETQIDSLKRQMTQLKKQHEQTLAVAKKVKQLTEDNRFFKNQMSITKKQLRSAQQRVTILEIQITSAATLQMAEHQQQLTALKTERDQMKLMKVEAEMLRQTAETEIQRLKGQMEQTENQNAKLRKKLESLMSERHLQPPPKPQQLQKPSQIDQARVKQLQMKLKNLQMLLRYKSGQGEVSSSFQMLVNNLTETISDKEAQLNEVKKINKSLLDQLKIARQIPH